MTRNVEMLVRAAEALGALKDEVVFVGGAIVDLFITDPAAPRPRFTQDVDVVVEVTTYGAWAEVGERLRALGFREDRREGAPLCRWLIEDLVVDVMPAPSACSGSRTGGIATRSNSPTKGISREASGSAP